MTRAIVALSGGMDSAVVLATVLGKGREVQAIGFDYGSKHNRWENQAAASLAVHYQVPFRLIDLSALMEGFRSHLLATGGAIPEGHYEDESMKQTVVPGRNTIFAAVLMGLAQSTNAREVWLGIHAGDHAIYPDCRAFWVESMQRVFRACESGVILRAPFLTLNKADILRQGLELKVPYHLTRTCYKAQEVACGKCGSCCERLEAFAKVGVEDPIAYTDRTGEES